MANFKKRLWAEHNKLKGLNTDNVSAIKFIMDSSPFDNDVTEPTTFNFTGRILPMSEPFNQSAFRVQINITDEYPGKPPEVRLLTKIHHPNVLEDGNLRN
jgi:ubiquitin-protein ligase